MLPLAGKSAVVTGGARGLGQAFAVALAGAGADVAILDIGSADDTIAAIGALGRQGFAVQVDLSIPDEATRAALETQAMFRGAVDIIVNNAGVFPTKTFLEMTFRDWRAVMAVNLDAMFLVTQPLVAGMRNRGWGRIINITSNTCWAVAPNFAHYVTSKMGVIGFTRALASEVGNHGITVNAIAPSLTVTPGTQASVPAAGFADWASAQAIARPSVPDDLIGALLFLAGDGSAFMTGQTLIVDGGLHRA